MNNILEDLKKYFRDTPREKVMSDWALAKKSSPKNSPKLSLIFETYMPGYGREKYHIMREHENNISSPEYSSGCFFYTT